MPGIEVLPTSTSIKSPGWALVPDTRGGPVQAAVQPAGGRQRAARNAGSKKTTPNVRRILMSQKTFANHLADEEAALAQQHNTLSSVTAPRTQGAKALPNLKRSATSEIQPTHGGPPLTPRDPLDDEPLLKSHVPTAPPSEVMEALLSGPPLSYNAARAAPPPLGKPQRQFCEICGYWGTIKCMKCGARVCGLECKVGHDESRCLKFYA
ncbi:zinc finger HIT domain-containing protein 1, partial [Lecanoromycetidae sp. Uapishka_2]